ELPTLRLLTRPLDDIRATARALRAPLAEAIAPDYGVAPADLSSQIGSGSLPVERLPSAGLGIEAAGRKGAGRAPGARATALRGLPLPVIGRIAEDRLLLDCRCLEDAAPFVAQLPVLRERLSTAASAPRPA